MTDLTSDRIVTAKRARPRGFVIWRPRTASRALVDDMLAVLVAYEQQFTSYLAACEWLLREHSQRLTPKEYAFLMNMRNRLPRRPPTERQAAWIVLLIEQYGRADHGA